MAKTTKKTTAKKATQRKNPSAKGSPRTAKKSTARSTRKSQSQGTPSKKASARKKTAGETEVTVDRRRADRRTKSVPVPVERRKMERRQKVARRRQIDPTTCERDYSDDEVEFMNALDNYKRASGRMFPTCSEILEVIRKLGYVKLPDTQNGPSKAPCATDTESPIGEKAVSADQNSGDLIENDVFVAEKVLA